MNYIHRLQQDICDLENSKSMAHDKVEWMISYLQSNKFMEDPYVNKQDLLPALLEIRLLLAQ